jgi:biopolymer transport protein ExbD
MNAKRAMGRSFRDLVENDLEIMPLMNLFVALIPMLLISAVFLNVTVIDMNAPPDGLADGQDQQAAEPLNLAVTIREDFFVIEGSRLKKAVIDRRTDDPAAALAKALTGVAQAFPENQDIMIISEAATRYDDIIQVMDISRAAGLPSASLLGAN